IEEREELQGNPQATRLGLGKEVELIWRQELAAQLTQARISKTEIPRSPKSAEWKIAIAAAMKARTTVTNRWLAEHLHMSGLHEVSRLVSRWNRRSGHYPTSRPS